MGKVSGDELTRGDRRRNEKLRVLREAIPHHNAVLAIDLAQSKQAAVVCGTDHEVLARRLFVSSVWGIDQMIDWAEGVAEGRGYAGITVACEPTGHRWKPILERSRRRSLCLICVSPMLVHRGREEEDLTRDRSDFKDAVIIARLARDLRGYIVMAPEASWARLRHLGARRDGKIEDRTAARLCLRDLLESYWPAALEAAKDLDSAMLRACLCVSTDPEEVVAMSYEDFAGAVRRQVHQMGGSRVRRHIVQAFYDAATDPRQLPWERAGASERASFYLKDMLYAAEAVAEVESRLVELVEALGLLDLATSIPGLSAVGAAMILAETGDPSRYDCGRSWAKHAGVCPRDNESGRFRGKTKASGRGRPRLRTAAWRAVAMLLFHNPVFKQRYVHLITREENRLKKGQARVALAGSLLRQMWAVLAHKVAWSPAVASGNREVMPAA